MMSRQITLLSKNRTVQHTLDIDILLMVSIQFWEAIVFYAAQHKVGVRSHQYCWPVNKDTINGGIPSWGYFTENYQYQLFYIIDIPLINLAEYSKVVLVQFCCI